MTAANSWDMWLLLTWKKALLLLVAWVACVALHNAVYAAVRAYAGRDFEEPFFFLLAVVVIPLYALAALAYTAYGKLFRPS